MILRLIVRPALLIFFITIFLCKPGVSQTRLSEVRTYFSNGKVIHYVTGNADSLIKVIVSAPGPLPDSVMTYRGKLLDGPALLLFEDGSRNEQRYSKDEIIAERLTNAQNELLYLFPFDTLNLEKTIIRISGGKDFISRNTYDTITILNKTIPKYNRMIFVSGASIIAIDGTSYLVHVNESSANITEIKLHVQIFGKADLAIKEEIFRILVQ
ncbi:MAG TPA: hypothetical protein PLL23_01085 [Chitinophagaceae bacterium]|nr:hypothetical protein [Chitinophagaceae bacterium]